MPSQEEYLDNLLKGISGGEPQTEPEPEVEMEPEPEPIPEAYDELFEDLQEVPELDEELQQEVEEDSQEDAELFQDPESVPELDDELLEELGAVSDAALASEAESAPQRQKFPDIPALAVEQELDMSDMDALLKAAFAEHGEDILEPGDFSEEDVINQLNAVAATVENGSLADAKEADLDGLVASMGDEGVSEIQTLLNRSDQNIPVDESVEELLREPNDNTDPLEIEGLSPKERKALKKKQKALEKKRKKEEKAAARANKTENADQKEKVGFFARLLNLVTEEDAEENNEAETDDANSLKLSEENKRILKEIDQEDGLQTPKPAAPKKKKKEKKPKNKPKKEKKPPKPKKKKAPKVKEAEAPGKRLSPKKIFIIALMGASIGAVTLICTYFLVDYQAKREGVTAFYNGDYQTCYQNLYGKSLNEQEQRMYAQSESILRIHMWLREYEILAEDGMEAEALDSLIQSVISYPAQLEYAQECGAEAEVTAVYGQMVQILNDRYHLTEEQAQAINAIRSDFEYSRMILDIVDGGDFQESSQVPTDSDREDLTGEELPDALPEEGEIIDAPFVDNAS